MTTIKLSNFLGEAPKIAEELLPERVAQMAVNCKLYSGDLIPFPQPTYAEKVTRAGTIRSMYPMRVGVTRYWLHWTSDVDVATSLLAEDSTQRVYYTGDGAPKQTDFSLATTGVGDYPIASRPLGVPVPTEACAATVSANTAATVTHRARTDNVATLTLSAAPNFGKGTVVNITGLADSTFNIARATIVDVSGSTIKYNCPGSNVTSTADTGSVAFAGSTLLRNYVYTWYTDWAEESPPSPASVDVSAYDGQKVTINTLPTTAPTGYSGIVTHKRVYRAVSSPSGAYYAFVEQVPLATATLVDDKTDRALGAVLESEDYDMPEATMRGIVNMANGILAGFFGNQVCFCEPYKPWAWPIKYRRTINGQVVGIAALNTSLVVMTERSPTLVTGTHPSVMSANRVDINLPCASKRSIVNMGHGVAYASPDGISFISTAGHGIVTKKIQYRDSWLAELNPTNITAAYYNGKYFASHSTGGFIFEQDDSPLGGVYTRVNFRFTAAHYDFSDGYLYFLSPTLPLQVLCWDDPSGDPGTFDWWSKRFRIPTMLNFGAARVLADYTGISSGALTPDQITHNGMVDDASALGDAALGEHVLGGGDWYEVSTITGSSIIMFRIYVNGAVKFEKQLTDNKIFRLPMGYKADNVEIRIASNTRVREIQLGETPSELRKV